MNKRNTPKSEVRLMSVDQLADYIGMGRNSALKFGAEAGAVKRFGRRVMYDRRIIDNAIDKLGIN